MKKIFKNTIKILTNTALIFMMLAGAERTMDLPLGWASVGYLALFGLALIVWSVYNSESDKFYKEGYNDGWEAKKINEEIYKEINKGEKDEFDIEYKKHYRLPDYPKSFEMNVIRGEDVNGNSGNSNRGNS